MPWLDLVVGLSLWRPSFDSRLVRVRFITDEVVTGQVFLRVL